MGEQNERTYQSCVPSMRTGHRPRSVLRKMSDITIIQTVWFPPGDVGITVAQAATKALKSWLARLSGATVRLHIADDGSHPDHLDAFRKPWPNATLTSAGREGCGGSLNVALAYVCDNGLSDAIAYMQADWTLNESLDLAPSLALLNGGVADIVRLGPTHPDLRGYVVRTEIPGAEWCLRYDWSYGGYVVGWRPALYHRRVFERFPLDGLEGLSAIEAERVWVQRMAADPNPPIVMHAPNCTLAGPFRHIDTVELGEDDPATLTARYA